MPAAPLVLQNRWVLVTGASSGLGREIARILAAEHGAKLVLVARREALLEELRRSLHAAHGTEIELIVADLSLEADVAHVIDRCLALGVQAAVLNAGNTHFGHFDELPFAGFQQLLALNVTGTVQLATALVSHWKGHNLEAGLLIVSSIAGLIPLPYQTAYAATKAFLVSFGLGLGEELAATGISVTVYAPGGIDTEFIANAGLNTFRAFLMPVTQAAQEAVKALCGRYPLRVPGVAQRLGVWGARLLPQKVLTAAAGSVFRRGLK